MLDLKTVFTWCDEVGVRRGVLYEDGKIEFDKWPAPPHDDIVDLFLRRQCVNAWPSVENPTFSGKHNQGEDPPFS